MGESLDLLIPERYRHAHREEYVPRLFQTRERRLLGEKTDLWGLKKGGEEIRLDIELNPVEFDGELCIIASIVDLTERERHERATRKLERELESAQRFENLGALAGGVAHEFNNLLQVISLHADLAVPHVPAESRATEDLRRIQDTVQKAAQLSSQMLAYAGKRSFVVERLDLNRVVAEMLELLQTLISKEAALTFSGSSGLPAIEAELSQVQQVITNLVKNAAEAMPDGEGSITVTTSALTIEEGVAEERDREPRVPGEYVVLEVTDTGRGMTDATLSRMFEPFFTTNPHSRGLGLAAVQGLVRAHRGYVTATSDAGVGTRFTILFPAMKSAAAAVQAEPEASLPDSLEQRTVLLIDDERAIRFAGKRMLEALDFKVMTAADGRDGVTQYRTSPDEIDCVLLDLTMPGMSGTDVFDELRSIRPGVQVIIVSGYGPEEISRRFKDEQPAGLIQKPYGRADLARALGAVPPVPD